jgi:hypothetical protein
MLRFFLLANCASCAIFGFLFVALTQESVAFIGTPPAIVVAGLGILLLINAALLALTVRRWQNTPAVIMFFVVGDVGWVVLTFGCLVSGLWIHGTTSTLASVLIAACVGGLGYGQYLFGVKGASA